MNSLHSEKEDLERALTGEPVPPPPSDLLDRIRRDIPESLPAHGGGTLFRFPFRDSRLRRVLPLAATLAIALGATYVGVRVARDTPLVPGGESEAHELVPRESGTHDRSAPAGLPEGSTPPSVTTERVFPPPPPPPPPPPAKSSPAARADREVALAKGEGQASRVEGRIEPRPIGESLPDAGVVDPFAYTEPSRKVDKRNETDASSVASRVRELRPAAPAALENGVAGGVEGGVEGGVVGGVAGGVPGGVTTHVAEAPTIALPSSARQAQLREQRGGAVQPMEIPSEKSRDAFRRSGAPPSTGGSAEPNDQPVGDMFFRSTGVNPFVDTEDDRFSTFGLDVDTGSYTLTRSYLDGGHLPPPEAIRVEEFVNAFDYPERVDARRDFTVHAEGAPSPFARAERLRLVRFHVQARPISGESRRPADLIFVVDVSGSMAREDRLGLVKRALALLLGELRDDDRVGLVVYGSRGRVLLAPTASHEAVRRAIGELVPEGSTNAEEGLRLAYDLAAESFRRGAVRRLILCSDGVANVGATGPESILARIGTAAREGIELSTFGFGMGNYNDALLEQLADQGNGRYAYIDDLAEAERLFVEQAAGTVPTVARDAKVQVEWNPETVERYRLLGYENRDVADERFRDDRVDAGEIGAGHAVTALYEVKLRDAAPFRLGRANLATLRLRYRQAESGRVVESAYDLARGDLASRWDEASSHLRLAAVAAELAERLKRSYWAKDSSPEVLIREARALARERGGEAGVAELAQLVARAMNLTRSLDPTWGQETDVPVADPRRLRPNDDE